MLSRTSDKYYKDNVEITKEEYEKYISKLQKSNQPTEQEILNAQLLEQLKQELATYDYIGVKIAMGVATKEDYAKEIAYTETLRTRIRELEK